MAATMHKERRKGTRMYPQSPTFKQDPPPDSTVSYWNHQQMTPGMSVAPSWYNSPILIPPWGYILDPTQNECLSGQSREKADVMRLTTVLNSNPSHILPLWPRKASRVRVQLLIFKTEIIIPPLTPGNGWRHTQALTFYWELKMPELDFLTPESSL